MGDLTHSYTQSPVLLDLELISQIARRIHRRNFMHLLNGNFTREDIVANVLLLSDMLEIVERAECNLAGGLPRRLRKQAAERRKANQK